MAPTGIAAQNIEGRTIDSEIFSKSCIKESNLIRTKLKKALENMEKTPNNVLEFIFECLDYKSYCIEYDYIVLVDEAFMIDCVTLCKLLFFFQKSKIIFFGDPYQLPPVMNLTGYCLSDFFECCNIKHYELFNIVRTENEFLKSLYIFLRNSIKEKTSFSSLNKNEKDKFKYFSHINDDSRFLKIEGYKSFVCISNAECNEINNSILKKMPTPIRKFVVRVTSGECSFLSKIIKENVFNSEFRFYPILETKIGAKIMFTKNSHDYKNGTLGIIKDIVDEDSIIAEIDGIDYTIFKQEFRCEKYNFTYYQFAFINAYALTFHKMQGLTITHPLMVQSNCKIDMRKIYVFFSRVKNPEQVYFNNEFSQLFFSGCFKKFEDGDVKLEGFDDFLKCYFRKLYDEGTLE